MPTAARQLRLSRRPRILDDFRIDAVTIADIISDYGASSGEFAMESAAFRRFSAIAETNGIRFEAAPYDGDESLMVVNVEEV